MTAALPSPGPDRGMKPPRHTAVPTAKGAAAYEKALLQAEQQAGQAVEHLLSEYLRILEVAGNYYARETERAIRAYSRIETPARKVYERQVEIAGSAFDSILKPADEELARIAEAAQDMYRSALAPIERAYQQAVADAQALTSGVSLSAVPGG